MQLIKELCSQVTLFTRTINALALELEKQASRISVLEENRKVKDAAITQLEKEVAMLKLLARKKAANA